MRHHLRSVSATSFQMLVNQVLGLLFFIGMASLLPKSLFGQVNWAIAVSTTLTIIASLGFDHVIVRQLSGGSSIADTVGLYITHTLILASLAILSLLIFHYVDPVFFQDNPEFFLIFIGITGTFLSMPYKQLANGKERFWSLALMGISGNLFRVLILFFLWQMKLLSPVSIAFMFLVSGIAEWVISLILGTQVAGAMIWPVFHMKAYKSLVKYSLPQTGVILLDSAFARIDWILMGILSTDAFTADYSFGYKAFESSRLPLLIIAPVILPKLSRLYSKGGLSLKASNELNMLWRMESIICVVIPLALNVCWEDLVNSMTQHQYGTSTRWVYAVLSLSLPMVYIVNFLWTLAFAQGRLKMIFYFTAITLSSNILLNLLLIPKFGALGAAMAFSISTLLQLGLYLWKVKEPILNLPIFDFIKTLIFAILSLTIVQSISLHWGLKLILACALYAMLLQVFKMIDWRKPLMNHSAES